MNPDTLAAALSASGLPEHWSFQVKLAARRRRLGLTVTPSGTVVVAVPPQASVADVVDAVHRRRLWLARRMRATSGVGDRAALRELVDGEQFCLLGRGHRLLLVDDTHQAIQLSGDRLRLRADLTGESGTRALSTWYAERGRRWLAPRIAIWAGRIGVRCPVLAVADLGSRWGERRRDGSVAVHWAAMQLEPDLLDLIMVHELVHLLENCHSADFRRRVRLAVTDVDERERRLHDAGSVVWLGGLRPRMGSVNNA